MKKPEQLARERIDRLLTDAGWALQDRDAFDRNAVVGVAVRESQLPVGPCDYLLFIKGKAAGVIWSSYLAIGDRFSEVVCRAAGRRIWC